MSNSRRSRYIKASNDIKEFKQHAAIASLNATAAIGKFANEAPLILKALKISGIEDDPIPLIKILGDTTKRLNQAIADLNKIEAEHTLEDTIKSSKAIRRFEEEVMNKVITLSTDQMEVVIGTIGVIINAPSIVAEYEAEQAKLAEGKLDA